MCVAKSSSNSALNTSETGPDHAATEDTTAPNPAASDTESNPAQFLEFEGSTTFAPPPASTYRYSLSLKSGKLRIWLEDCKTKQQWCTSRLDLEDYVDRSNALPSASAADYVKYFRYLIDRGHDDEVNKPVTFKRKFGEFFQLQVAVKVNVMQQPHVAMYTFDMEPISLERIDVLESKLRDMQLAIDSLRSSADQVAATHSSEMVRVEGDVATHSSAVLRLDRAVASNKSTVDKLVGFSAAYSTEVKRVDAVATTNSSSVQHLNEVTRKLRQDLDANGRAIKEVRNEVTALRVAQDTPSVFETYATAKIQTQTSEWIHWNGCPDGILHMNLPGTYYLAATVNFHANNAGTSIQLIKENECLQVACCGYTQGMDSSVSFSRIIHVEKSEQVAVYCPERLVGTSHMTLVRLGN